jgi:mannose-6-phosphate isomerase-like protein (cupin superfamily)
MIHSDAPLDEDPTDSTAPFVVGPDGGDPRWVTGSLDTIKVTAAQTRGRFGLIESHERKGDAPPLHVHETEDEAYYVIEGQLTFFIGDDVMPARAGTLVFAPRRIPHTYRVDSATSRIIVINAPGGWERFFTEAGESAVGRPNPPDEDPDFDRLSALAANYGVTILGPPPE